MLGSCSVLIQEIHLHVWECAFLTNLSGDIGRQTGLESTNSTWDSRESKYESIDYSNYLIGQLEMKEKTEHILFEGINKGQRKLVIFTVQLKTIFKILLLLEK